jgi:hypothetical protein
MKWHMPGQKTWGEGKRCDECCNGDRCDDPTHLDRENCPHCMSTGWALWTQAGKDDYVKYLQRYMPEEKAKERLETLLKVKP